MVSVDSPLLTHLLRLQCFHIGKNGSEKCLDASCDSRNKLTTTSGIRQTVIRLQQSRHLNAVKFDAALYSSQICTHTYVNLFKSGSMAIVQKRKNGQTEQQETKPKGSKINC